MTIEHIKINSLEEIIKISASDNYYLTAKSDVKDKVFSKTIYLGINDSAENYNEVTEEYKQIYESNLNIL